MNSDHRRLAAKSVRRQAKRLAGQLRGVRAAEDIEFVHRARVATRRLRAALMIFADCFAPKRVRRWRKAIRRVADALGDARDRDVQIEFLDATLASLDAKECFPGIAHLLVGLERDRRRLQRGVVKAVDRLESKNVTLAMRQSAQKILGKKKAASQGRSALSGFGRVEKHVVRRIDELLAHQDSLIDPEDRLRHHSMRIAAKSLRYTLEISRSLYPGRLGKAVKAVRRLQSLLGEIHDCDVWLDHLAAFESTERGRMTAAFGHAGGFARLRPGVEFLRSDRLGHRQKTFQELLEYWSELDRREFWVELKALVHVADGPVAAIDRPSREEVSPNLPKPLLTTPPRSKQ